MEKKYKFLIVISSSLVLLSAFIVTFLVLINSKREIVIKSFDDSESRNLGKFKVSNYNEDEYKDIYFGIENSQDFLNNNIRNSKYCINSYPYKKESLYYDYLSYNGYCFIVVSDENYIRVKNSFNDDFDGMANIYETPFFNRLDSDAFFSYTGKILYDDLFVDKIFEIKKYEDLRDIYIKYISSELFTYDDDLKEIYFKTYQILGYSPYPSRWDNNYTYKLTFDSNYLHYEKLEL